MITKLLTLAFCVFLLSFQSFAVVWNNPHDEDPSENIYYSTFLSPPKTLDPAQSYSSDQSTFTNQVYEPPLQYHYLKRPYELIPLTASEMPQVRYFDKKDKELKKPIDFTKVAYTLYNIKIKPGILYEPHPAFAKDEQGNFLYHNLQESDLEGIAGPHDFSKKTTRELVAADYVYQIKRLANPRVSSPIYGLMSEYIVGLSELAENLKKEPRHGFLDLRKHELAGVKILGKYHYQVKVKGAYAQFLYWMAMPFFAPMPWEATRFHSQKALIDNNITLDWYPIGTGPYFLAKNDPNKEMILQRNPSYREEFYPSEGGASDKKNGFLKLAGQRIPFIDSFVFNLEKEALPRWNKFLQGYFDISEIATDSFDQAISIDKNGKPSLTEEMLEKGIKLQSSIHTAVYYLGFNMFDPVVGGESESARKLRLAIGIALDYGEYISIFLNGRGVEAHGPVPPGIFGFQEGEKGLNPYLFNFNKVTKQVERKHLKEAKKLMAEAGYPNGINPKTGKALILNYDVTSRGDPGDQSKLNWLRRQFAKIGIQLNIRSTQYNRFKEKVRTGNAQMFFWGWLADYPDPENFLFLLYGPNGKVKYGGENAANYENPEFDKLFSLMKNMENGPERAKVIQKMLKILRHDSPWLWGYHPVNFMLSHNWNSPRKLHGISGNVLKYQKIDPKKRLESRKNWNRASLMPLFYICVFLIALMVPLVFVYQRRENTSTIKRL